MAKKVSLRKQPARLVPGTPVEFCHGLRMLRGEIAPGGRSSLSYRIFHGSRTLVVSVPLVRAFR